MEVFKRDYVGFESAIDIEQDIGEMWDDPRWKTIPGEYRGTLRVTVEYIPSDEDPEIETKGE